jgi:hypothetical protein
MTNAFQINGFSVRSEIRKFAKIFEEIEDPSAFGVLCLLKYLGQFTNFTSHAKLIDLKNIGCDCGNTRTT